MRSSSVPGLSCTLWDQGNIWRYLVLGSASGGSGKGAKQGHLGNLHNLLEEIPYQDQQVWNFCWWGS